MLTEQIAEQLEAAGDMQCRVFANYLLGWLQEMEEKGMLSKETKTGLTKAAEFLKGKV